MNEITKEVIKEEVRESKKKVRFWLFGAAIICFLLAALSFGIALGMNFGFDKGRLTDILKTVNQSPSFSVIHGFYNNPMNPRESGLRMIRVDNEGFLICPDCICTKKAEK